MAVLSINNLDLIRLEENSILIKDISLNIDAGEVILLSGRNGIGKTTFIDALTNNLGSDRTSHSVLSGRFEVAGAPPDEKLFERVIYVPQQDYISFPFVTVFNALLDGCPFPRKEAKEYLKNWINKYKPFTVNDNALLKKRIGNLSGGEKKYVAIIQSILRCDNPKIQLIILDEPINSLDSTHVQLLSNLLLRIKNNNPQIGFLIVSHCHAFPYISSVYEIKNNKLISGTYCRGTCFGDIDDKGYYFV